jgi:4-hydroxy-tetrahydrodipicolinate synthase
VKPTTSRELVALRGSEAAASCSRGDFTTALQYQDRLTLLHRALFLEPNPAGPKYALHVLERMLPEVRLPLVGVSPTVATEIESALRHAGIVG